jgi:hypothetical protein
MFSQNDSAFWNQNLSPNANHKNNDIYLEHLDNTKDLSHKPISNEREVHPFSFIIISEKPQISKKKGMLIQWLKI